MDYKISDIFYSVQGEGVHTGTAMHFIRLAGCNINCEFCDTNHKEVGVMNEEAILASLGKSFSNKVVITGGEPLLQDVKPLCSLLRRHGFKIHLETNGSLPIQGEFFDWITISPKTEDISQENLHVAYEIKFLYPIENFVQITRRIKNSFLHAVFWIMPIEVEGDLLQTKINKSGALRFVLENPSFRLCAQTHKLYGFK